MQRLFVRVVADGFPSSSSSDNGINIPSSIANPSTISSLLLERNLFYKKLSGVNRTNSTIKLLDRNFCCILPQNLSLGDVKQTICRQYQSIFYEKVNEGTIESNTDAFTLSRLYSDLGLELGLWNTQLKACDIFTDEQVVFAKLDCSRKQGIKLKEKYQHTEQFLSPDGDKEQTSILFETPKKRKPTSTDILTTPQSKKKKLATPPSASSSSDDSDSSVSNTEDEDEFVSHTGRKPRSTTMKQQTIPAMKVEKTITIESDEESEKEEEEKAPVQKLKEEKKQPEKKDTQKKAPVQKPKEEKKQPEKKAQIQKQKEEKKQEVKKQKEEKKQPVQKQKEEKKEQKKQEQESEEESEESEEQVEDSEEESKNGDEMTPEQYAKFFANTKHWLNAKFVGGKFKNDSDKEDMKKAFSQLTKAHQQELLELMKTMVKK